MVIPSTSYKEEVNKLIAKKEGIEKTINDCGEILLANQNIGMNGKLLDDEGFPRADIDVYAVREARHKIICLQNDLKSIMKEIENGLINLHAEARTSNVTATTKMWALNSKHTNYLRSIAKTQVIFFFSIKGQTWTFHQTRRQLHHHEAFQPCTQRQFWL